MQQNRENLVRIDETAIFSYGSYTVGVAVGSKAGVAAFFHDSLPEHRDMGNDRFGIDVRKQRVQFLPDSHVLDAVIAENSR